MDPKFLKMSVKEAFAKDPESFKVVLSSPSYDQPVSEFIKHHDQELDLSSLPQMAMVTGIADDEDARRVGVFGYSVDNTGVYGLSDNKVGVYGRSHTGHAGYFRGKVKVEGKIECVDVSCVGADFAEDFTVSEAVDVQPGTVVVLSDDGTLVPSAKAYDKRVAGVVSGAGAYRPGIVLDRDASDSTHRQPVALLGKVYCRVDATRHPLAIGDLLTTSTLSGHAMKAVDPARSHGAVIGKALAPLEAGTGLVPILVALQ